MAVNPRAGEWEGGYVSRGKNGRLTYFIERMVGGVRYHVSTRCHEKRSALRQLDRFESNPAEYRPNGEVDVDDEAPPDTQRPPLFTAKLILEFEDYSLKVRENTRNYAREMTSHLTDWMEDLNGREFRGLNPVTGLKPLLKRHKGQAHRIIAIKAYCSWLRSEKGLLKTGEDPTLDLVVPQSRPEKWKRRKAVDEARVQAAFAKLQPAYRDVLTLLGATGWHVTELQRFVRRPESEIRYPPPGGAVLAVLAVRHKGGEETRTPITTAEALGAAERLRMRGGVPRNLNMAVKAACDAAGVPRFTFGVMRHTVGTWAVERGAAPAHVSEFLGHKDPRTTKRFYLDVAVPTVSVPLPTLRLVEGGKS